MRQIEKRDLSFTKEDLSWKNITFLIVCEMLFQKVQNKPKKSAKLLRCYKPISFEGRFVMYAKILAALALSRKSCARVLAHAQFFKTECSRTKLIKHRSILRSAQFYAHFRILESFQFTLIFVLV